MLQVSVPIAYELLAQCIKQGEALVQRASLVGDFSDYESWKAARSQWVDPTVQALAHIYGGPTEAREFAGAATCPEGSKRWQEQYGADLKCVKQGIDFLTVLQGELAFENGGGPVSGELVSAGTALATGEQRHSAGEARPAYAEQPHAASQERADLTGALVELQGRDADAREERAPNSEQEPSVHRSPEQEPFVDRSPEQEPFVDRSREREHTDEPEDEPNRTGAAESFSAPRSEELRNEEPLQERPTVGAELAHAQQHVGAELAQHAQPAPPDEREPHDAPATPRPRDVYLAHGRDEKWKQAVEHLLEQAGEHEIKIVNRRASERARLTEELREDAPGSHFAVVLLTADDVGGARLESDAEPYFSTRAHQEVVFEMGFLVAALSPGRVCVLYEDGVEMPCDLGGVSHVRLDLAGTWQPKLLLHLRRAGFDYDMNKLAAA